MITLRSLTIDDYEMVYSLWISTKGMGLNSIDDSRQGIEKYLKRNPHTCFVASVENEIVGAILSGHDGRRGFIYHLAVEEHYRRMGIGKSLVEASVNALKQEGITKVGLVVFEHNELGNKFWDRLGFIVRKDLIYRNITISQNAVVSSRSGDQRSERHCD